MRKTGKNLSIKLGNKLSDDEISIPLMSGEDLYESLIIPLPSVKTIKEWDVVVGYNVYNDLPKIVDSISEDSFSYLFWKDRFQREYSVSVVGYDALEKFNEGNPVIFLRERKGKLEVVAATKSFKSGYKGLVLQDIGDRIRRRRSRRRVR